MNTRAFYKKICLNTTLNSIPILIAVYSTSFIMTLNQDVPQHKDEENPTYGVFSTFSVFSKLFDIMMITVMNLFGASSYGLIKKFINTTTFEREFWPGLLKSSLSTISTIMIGQHNNPLPIAIQFYLTDSISALYATLEYESSIESSNRPVILPTDTQSKTSHKTFQERLDAIHFQGEIPSEFIDCVDREIMNEPYILNSGHSIDRITADHILKNGNKKCPISRIEITTCIKNINLHCAINQFVTALESDYHHRYEKKDTLRHHSLFKKSASAGDLRTRQTSSQMPKPLTRGLQSLL